MCKNHRLSFILAFLCSASLASAEQQSQVTARLLTDVAAVQPGETFTVGVLLDIRVGWHVYWKHPGDGGVATEVEFIVPDGFTVGEVRFPVPMKFVQPGAIAGYGYKDQVMLLADITAPTDLNPGREVEIRAEPAWLSCDPFICVPGEASLGIELPVAAEATPDHAELFAAWRERLPVRLDASDRVAAVEIASTAGDIDDGALEVEIRWNGEAPDGVEAFFHPPAHLMLSESSLRSDGDRSRISARVGPVPGDGGVTLPVVVAFEDEQGTRRGVETELEIKGDG